MLHILRARNLGLIRDGEIEPVSGLTVITGETGAGKTLLLGALRLLLGEGADASLVGPFHDAAQADGVFFSDSELGVSRIVPAKGRSRSYLNGTITSSDTLGEVIGALVEIVGQHDRLQLRNKRHILGLLDQNLGEEGTAILAAYRDAWSLLQERLGEAEALGGSEAELARELDLVRFQSNEIAGAGLAPGDDAVLEAQQSRLRNANELKEHLAAAIEAVTSIDDAGHELVSRMRKVNSLDPATKEYLESAETISISGSELARDLSAAVEDLVEDPETLASIEQRLNLLGELKRKYGRTIEEILHFGDMAARRAEELGTFLGRAGTIQSEIAAATETVRERGDQLTEVRARVARALEESIIAHLSEVGLDQARVRFEFVSQEPAQNGSDKVDLQFSSHSGLQPGPIGKVASGGELSRLILAVSLATSSAGAETLVFDEVDAGVGGATALAMGRKLAELAGERQILCVTHLPQVAAFADAHYVVSRTPDEAIVTRVVAEDRLEELSRMIAGLPESERGQQAAAELLELTGKGE